MLFIGSPRRLPLPPLNRRSSLDHDTSKCWMRTLIATKSIILPLGKIFSLQSASELKPMLSRRICPFKLPNMMQLSLKKLLTKSIILLLRRPPACRLLVLTPISMADKTCPLVKLQVYRRTLQLLCRPLELKELCKK